MRVEFKQKKGFSSRSFILTDDKIFVEEVSKNNISKYELKLDKIGLDIYYKADNRKGANVLRVIFYLISLCAVIVLIFTTKDAEIKSKALFVLFIFGLLSFFFSLDVHQDDIYLLGHQSNLVFYRNKPDEKSVLEFVEKVRAQIRTYLRLKYGSFDSTTTEEDFYYRINWLRDKEVIDQAEFIELKAKFDTFKLL